MKATNVVQDPPSPWTGRGIRVAILDTGIDLDHPNLKARVAAATSLVPGCPVQDAIGHGTHCAGTAVGFKDPQRYRYGIAYNADLYVARVLDETGRTEAATVIAGMDWALSLGCDLISLSLGTFDSAPSPEFEAAGRRALDADCLIVAAAGNGRSGAVVQPANADSILAVGAVDNWLNAADFTGCAPEAGDGRAVDIVAPGVDVYSAAPFECYAARDGTSMATAHVAGIAALWAEAEGLRGWALWQRLLARAQRLPSSPTETAPRLVTAP